jgi:hypothetical protein
VAALRSGQVSLAVHAVLIRRVLPEERASVLGAIGSTKISAGDLDTIFDAIGWERLRTDDKVDLDCKLKLLEWLTSAWLELRGRMKEDKLLWVADNFPMDIALASHANSVA